MASNGPSYGRPWGTTGLNWLAAVAAALIAALGLLHAIEVTATLVQVEVLLLALAMLL